jgi:molybdenum cofactor biosynthesis enzyme MoaA
MKIQTFSIVAGSEACNASCPFCVSKMTVANGVPEGKAPDVNWGRFEKACRLAQLSGVTTAMITGKGEPTLFPDQVSAYLHAMWRYQFPLVEIQSNGIPIYSKMTAPNAEVRARMQAHLQEWLTNGLTTIAVSVVGVDPELNRKIYLPHSEKYIELDRLVQIIHEAGFSVRLACVMISGGVDSPEKVAELATWAKEHKVEQVTIRPVNKTDKTQSHDDPTYVWAGQNGLDVPQKIKITNYLNGEATKLMTLQHGATVYDLNGQNVCLTDSLTRSPDGEDLRQLIFFPDGHIRYDWQYEGAILV